MREGLWPAAEADLGLRPGVGMLLLPGVGMPDIRPLPGVTDIVEEHERVSREKEGVDSRFAAGNAKRES